jgi:hypothetical protein
LDSKKSLQATQDMRFSQMCSESLSLLGYDVRLGLPVDGGSKLLWNTHTYVPNYMVSSQKIGIFSFWNDLLFVVKVCINIMVLEAILSSYLFNSLPAKWTCQPWSNFCFICSLWEYVIWCRVFFWHLFFCWSGEYCTFQCVAVRQNCR